MSIRLMASAWELDIPSTEKMVLLCLCDHSNDVGVCWPSVPTIAKKCSKSDRTVQAAIQWLRVEGYCSWDDTPGKPHRFALNPRQICSGNVSEYRHYVYRIEDADTGCFYIGARSCQGAIEDDGYMGSGNWAVGARKAGHALRKTILEIVGSRDELARAELRHVQPVFGSPNCKNEKLPTPGTLIPLTPADSAPRRFCTPQELHQTPAELADEPSRTIIPKKDKPSLVSRATRVAPDFVPVMSGKTASVVDGWPPGRLADEIEHFVDHHTAKGTTSYDWQASWRTWVKNSKRWEPRNGQHQQPVSLRGTRPDPSLDFVRQANADLAAERRGAADHRGDRPALSAGGSG